MTKQKKLYDFCVYTMRNRQDLEFIMAGDGKASFQENKTWKTAYKLLKDAENKDQIMPIFFSAADEHSGLIYFAQIEDIQIESN